MSPELICLPIMALLLAFAIVARMEARRWKRLADSNFERAKDALDTCHKWESNYSHLMELYKEASDEIKVWRGAAVSGRVIQTNEAE